MILESSKNERKGFEGKLPAQAPLANPYVPFQLDNPPRYEPRKALVRGTLFPGLDLPFMGMINKNELPVTPLTELQTMAFMILEMALYLDTHADDKEALKHYQSYQEIYHKCMMEYTDKKRPLNHRTPAGGSCYRWLDDPWPWEYAANKEV